MVASKNSFKEHNWLKFNVNIEFCFLFVLLVNLSAADDKLWILANKYI